MELRADLDQVDGLSSEREALWARIERASFLTLDEKRAAVVCYAGGAVARRCDDHGASMKYLSDLSELQWRILNAADGK